MADITLDGEFGDPGKTLSVEQTAAILKARYRKTDFSLAWGMGNTTSYDTLTPDLESSIAPTLSVDGGKPPESSLDTFFVELAKSIPENLRTEAVMRTGDIRPLLNKVQGQGEVDKLKPVKAGDATFTPAQRRLAGALMVTETVEQTNKYKAALQGRGLSPEAIDVAVNDFRRGYTDGIIRRVPDPKGEAAGVGPDGLPVASSDATDDVNEALTFDASTDATSQVDPFEYLTYDEVQQLLQENSGTDEIVGKLLENEQLGIDTRAEGGDVTGDPLRVTYEQGKPSRGGQLPPGANATAQAGYESSVMNRKTYGLSEVVRLPSTMTAQEVNVLSKKLEKGGYFDLAGGKPTLKGDPTDPVFKRAWRLLVGQSIESRRPMMEILDDRTRAYQEQIDTAVMTKLTDPARIRMSTDAVGQSMLGRKLTPQEHEDMTNFVHELERRNARLEAGLDPDSNEDKDQEGIMADVQARIEEKIRGDNETEALSHDTAGQYDVFSTLLRGPGRGI